MPLTYAIADLHGRYDLLSEAITKIVEHSKSDRPVTIITLGDYVDRGPKSRQVIERLMGWGTPAVRLARLKANPEVTRCDRCRQAMQAGWLMENGGAAALTSCGEADRDCLAVHAPRAALSRRIEDPSLSDAIR